MNRKFLLFFWQVLSSMVCRKRRVTMARHLAVNPASLAIIISLALVAAGTAVRAARGEQPYTFFLYIRCLTFCCVCRLSQWLGNAPLPLTFFIVFSCDCSFYLSSSMQILGLYPRSLGIQERRAYKWSWSLWRIEERKTLLVGFSARVLARNNPLWAGRRDDRMSFSIVATLSPDVVKKHQADWCLIVPSA